MQQKMSDVRQLYSKGVLWTSSISSPWKIVRSANSQAQPRPNPDLLNHNQIFGLICVSINLLSGSCMHLSLRIPLLRGMSSTRVVRFVQWQTSFLPLHRDVIWTSSESFLKEIKIRALV